MPDADASARAHAVIAAALAAGATVATAESITAGAVCAALVSVPGASAVVRGAVVAYVPDVKQRVLGVDPHTIEHDGVVSERTALEMAHGARTMLEADLAVATTGAAGPQAHDGTPAGTVCIAVVWEGGEAASTSRFEGDRAEVTAAAVREALRMAGEALASGRGQAGSAHR